MNRTRATGVGTVVLLTLASAGCGGSDDIAESIIERGIESESGGDVDIEFDDDGNMIIETEEGRVEFNTDGDGNFSIEGSTDEGDFSVESEDGQMTIESEDGQMTIESDDGQTVIESEDGDVTIESDDGEMTIESDDGSISISEGGDIPDGFPSDIPLPDDLTIILSQVFEAPEGTTFTVVFTSPDPFDTVGPAFMDALEADGWTQQSLMTTGEGGFFAYDNGEWNVSGFYGPESAEEGTSMSVNVTPSTEG